MDSLDARTQPGRLAWSLSTALPRAVARTAVIPAVLAGSLFASPALGCPRCATGQEARRAAFAEGFTRNLAVAALPFVIVGAASALLHGVGRRPPRRRGAFDAPVTGADA